MLYQLSYLGVHRILMDCDRSDKMVVFIVVFGTIPSTDGSKQMPT